MWYRLGFMSKGASSNGWMDENTTMCRHVDIMESRQLDETKIMTWTVTN